MRPFLCRPRSTEDYKIFEIRNVQISSIGFVETAVMEVNRLKYASDFRGFDFSP